MPYTENRYRVDPSCHILYHFHSWRNQYCKLITLFTSQIQARFFKLGTWLSELHSFMDSTISRLESYCSDSRYWAGAPIVKKVKLCSPSGVQYALEILQRQNEIFNGSDAPSFP